MPPEEPEKELIFHDITNATNFQPSAEIPWTALTIIATVFFLILALILIIIKNRLSNTIVSKSTPVSDAINQLKLLRDRAELINVQEAATELSTLIRETLTRVTNAPALYQSQQEFHQDSIELHDKDLMQNFQSHLDSLWNLEYSAPQQNPALVKDQLATTEDLLSKLSRYHA